MASRNKRRPLVVLALFAFLLPLMRFLSSPTAETARSIDIALLFASGMGAGVLAAVLFGRRSRRAQPSTGEA